MKPIALALLALCAASSLAQPASAPVRPNQPVFHSGPWFVVRSERPGGVVACTGFYRANRAVQLSKDMLIIKTAEEVKGVAFAFDREPMPAQRPLSAGEKELDAIALTGEDFAKLTRSHMLRIEATTSKGVVRHPLELRGLAEALKNINDGCPPPAHRP